MTSLNIPITIDLLSKDNGLGGLDDPVNWVASVDLVDTEAQMTPVNPATGVAPETHRLG